jgi:hypothetical protein
VTQDMPFHVTAIMRCIVTQRALRNFSLYFHVRVLVPSQILRVFEATGATFVSALISLTVVTVCVCLTHLWRWIALSMCHMRVPS